MTLYHVDRAARLWEGRQVGPSDDLAGVMTTEVNGAARGRQHRARAGR